MAPELVVIRGGRFLMGNDRARDDERPAHAVAIEAFRAAVGPVSNAEYRLFVEATGAAPPRFWDNDVFDDPEQPAVGVSWFEAVAYCRWAARETGVPFRLPTEAEREYAALGGLKAADWPWGPEPPAARPEMQALACLDRPHRPRLECANGYGLLCMGENVHEWCSDWYDARYYAVSPEQAPVGPTTGRRRASRGGAWRHQVKFARVSARSSLDPSFRYNDYGFRVYADA